MATKTVVWGERTRLRTAAYLSDQMSPLVSVTSVRAVVLRDGHVLPGGQREHDGSPEAPLRREMAEETGWSLGRLTVLGFMHLRHLDPKPPDYGYPYPDFCWLVYVAEAERFSPEAKLDDGYAVGSEFLTVEAARALPLTPCRRAVLDAAVRLAESLR